MYTDINQQLDAARQDVFRLRKIEAMRKELLQERDELEAKVVELRERLAKEKLDVERLEKLSLTALFHSVLGKLDERMEKERGEALAAKLKYEQAATELKEINQELHQLTIEWRGHRDAKRKYEELLAQKKAQMLESDTETADRLQDITDQLEAAKNNLKEIKEAIDAGLAVDASLGSTLDSLNSARSWGVVDMLGGGLLVDFAKHSHIDTAKQEAQRAQSLLRRFRTELADVQINCQIDFETGGFAKFADFFFDGLIFDWIMQSKINNSRESVSRVQREVLGVIRKLRKMEVHELEMIAKLKQQMKALVVNS